MVILKFIMQTFNLMGFLDFLLKKHDIHPSKYKNKTNYYVDYSIIFLGFLIITSCTVFCYYEFFSVMLNYLFNLGIPFIYQGKIMNDTSVLNSESFIAFSLIAFLVTFCMLFLRIDSFRRFFIRIIENIFGKIIFFSLIVSIFIYF